MFTLIKVLFVLGNITSNNTKCFHIILKLNQHLLPLRSLTCWRTRRTQTTIVAPHWEKFPNTSGASGYSAEQQQKSLWIGGDMLSITGTAIKADCPPFQTIVHQLLQLSKNRKKDRTCSFVLPSWFNCPSCFNVQGPPMFKFRGHCCSGKWFS